MRWITFTLFIFISSGASLNSIFAQNESNEPSYEMTTYYMAFLKKGPKWSPKETEETNKVQAAHLANIQKLVDEGKMILAGPFLDEWEVRGIFVYKVDSMEEAIELTKQDPAVIAGRLSLELHPWYSAKGITIMGNKNE
ncbi:MAG: YciI family protein [Ignavibacteriaceae bacterium]|jgi:uncharacterized protein YciI